MQLELCQFILVQGLPRTVLRPASWRSCVPGAPALPACRRGARRSLVRNVRPPEAITAPPGRHLRHRTAVAAAQRGARCVPRALFVSAVVVVEAKKYRFSEAELRVWLHADERERPHHREQLRGLVPRRLLRQSRTLPQQRVRGWRLLRREQEDLPDRVPCLSRHLPTAFVAAVAAAATMATSITARALLSWRRLRVLGRQPVWQGPVAHTCEWVG
jgi:hypothetical protein